MSCTSRIRRVLDIGCGAGNNTLKLREAYGRDFDAHLLDLSRPMLERAARRLGETNHGAIRTIQGDFRTAALEDNTYDVISPPRF